MDWTPGMLYVAIDHKLNHNLYEFTNTQHIYPHIQPYNWPRSTVSSEPIKYEKQRKGSKDECIDSTLWGFH
jgi:hypothetical protein